MMTFLTSSTYFADIASSPSVLPTTLKVYRTGNSTMAVEKKEKITRRQMYMYIVSFARVGLSIQSMHNKV